MYLCVCVCVCVCVARRGSVLRCPLVDPVPPMHHREHGIGRASHNVHNVACFGCIAHALVKQGSPAVKSLMSNSPWTRTSSTARHHRMTRRLVSRLFSFIVDGCSLVSPRAETTSYSVALKSASSVCAGAGPILISPESAGLAMALGWSATKKGRKRAASRPRPRQQEYVEISARLHCSPYFTTSTQTRQ